MTNNPNKLNGFPMNKKGGLAPVILLVLLLLFFGLHLAGFLTVLIINGLVGLLIIILLNFLPVIEIPINGWTLLIAAIGGVPGIILLVILNILKVDLT